MSKEMRTIEIGIAFDNGGWEVECVDIPESLAQEENTDKIVEWINENNPFNDVVGIFIYNIGSTSKE